MYMPDKARSCGCDYQVKGYTTRDEAHRMAMLLDLQPGSRLLDVGAGAGWPGLFFAKETGCDIVLVDVPLDGLRAATKRAVKDRISDHCWAAVAAGSPMPSVTAKCCAACKTSAVCSKLAVGEGLVRRDLFVATPTLA